MLQEKYVFRRCVWLLATVWCAATPIPGIAGRPATPEENAASIRAEVPAVTSTATGQLAANDLLPNTTDLLARADAAREPITGSTGPSQNVTVNLINRLVERGVLTKQDSQDLIRLAEEDAAVAHAQAATVQHDVAIAREAAQAAVQQTAPPMTDDQVRVTYIPESVKAQMRDEIKEEVLAKARAENWAAPNSVPDWVPRFRVAGDIRVRYEGVFFPGGNDNTGAFPIFNAINAGAPFDVAGTVFSPQNNVDQSRNRFRIRTRLGAEISMGEGFTVGLRIGSGQDNSPVTENQSLGLANNAQGGNFSKYQVWIDRAFLKYETGGQTNKNLAVTVGRMENPFWDPTSMIWSRDLGFDGVAIQAKYEVAKGITPFFNGGAFPVFNTDFNFATNNPSKFRSEDKYLYGAQLGTNLKISKDLSAKVAGQYYYFYNTQGKLSDPFTPLTAQDAGNTDDSRPSFAQNGNTYMALRNITPDATNGFGTTNQFQYFGLASSFHELAFSGQIDYNRFEPAQISLYGQWVKNLALDRPYANSIAVNNRGPNTAIGGVGAYSGGDTAWNIGIRVGKPAMEKFGDWNVGIDYRHVESDAVIDGFTDADFGAPLYGTNLKGYTLRGNLALSRNVWLGVWWMSADSIVGPPFKSDVLQVDINGKF
ncbi:MAG: putative porin [Chthoniobacter sp.]|uniref:putative porin n=1 Tax=Chthoniobacter sp. TaxID=2510640 RepID=UPI0032AC5AB7